MPKQVDYKQLIKEVTLLSGKIITGKIAEEKMDNLLVDIIEDNPSSSLGYCFHDWDNDKAKNFLLHFIEMKGLSIEAAEFFEKCFDREVPPKEESSQR